MESLDIDIRLYHFRENNTYSDIAWGVTLVMLERSLIIRMGGKGILEDKVGNVSGGNRNLLMRVRRVVLSLQSIFGHQLLLLWYRVCQGGTEE